MNGDSTLEMMENPVLAFYGIWQMVVCLFAFLGLIAIWWHLGRKQGDFGQVWLALSILSWSISGAVEVSLSDSVDSVYIEGFRSIFSLFNSLFILLALPWFRYLPLPIAHIIKSGYWKYIVVLPFVFSLLPTVNRMLFAGKYTFISELDVYYAVMTLLFLGWVLWESFEKRCLKMLAWLSMLCIITTFVAQIYKLLASDINLTLLSAIFKTSLIMLFFALALSWVKDLSENVIPDCASLFITLSRIKNENNKFDHQLTIIGVPGKSEPFAISQTLFGLMLKFAMCKKKGDGWLHIKPKNDPRSEKVYDIRDHNEIRRLNQALTEGIFGKDWNKELHELPLKAAVFDLSENRNRKIRLAIPAENIMIAEELVAT
ncbi:MAG: hypothetical protein WBA74_08500 [Cyclobacteriaceae bacterium]